VLGALTGVPVEGEVAFAAQSLAIEVGGRAVLIGSLRRRCPKITVGISDQRVAFANRAR